MILFAPLEFTNKYALRYYFIYKWNLNKQTIRKIINQSIKNRNNNYLGNNK